MKKISIKNRLYDVVTMDEYLKNKALYDPKTTAIEYSDVDYILPLKTSDTPDPGYRYINNCPVVDFIPPNYENMQDYSSNNIINYDDVKSIDDIIRNNNMLKNIQQDMMINTDNALCLTISETDSAEMIALKTAINSKKIDKMMYADRFTQFQNDMRLLKGSSITLSKMLSICEAFDIEVSLTLKDVPGALNPMGRTINANLSKGVNSNETE